MTSNSLNCICATPSPMQFFQAYTGIVFTVKKAGICKVYAPNFKNIFHSKVPSGSGSEMCFKDSWTTNSLLVDGSTEKIDYVTLKELWEYANSNLLWDEIKEQLSFKDIEVGEITLYDFVKDIDSFLVYNRLTKFGNVWWIGKAVSDLEGDDSRNVNVNIPNVSGYGFGSGGAKDLVKFWSADKYINDEYKKYNKDPTAYNGAINSDDFTSNGWITVPDLKISTKPFEKLKIAQILLNLNYSFDPNFFGKYYTVDSTLGTRIKDSTSNSVLDISQTKANQNNASYSDTIINHWIGGLTNTANLQSVGELGKYAAASCTAQVTSADTEISHLISAQITLNPEYDNNKKEVLNTIDPINWISSELNINPRKIGLLNVDRAFGGANGTADEGIVFGGIQKTETSAPKMLDTIEIWDSIGFMKNVQTQANYKRSFHLQGGYNSKTAVMIGGFSDFNYIDLDQFSEYGKTNVRNDMEVFIKSDNPLISYFKKVPSVSLTVARGDAAGVLNVSVKDRQDKFNVAEALKTYVISKEDEQRVTEFVDKQSQNSNAKRYTITNIDGFIYGGNTTGNSYLTTQSQNDIIDTFEKISCVFIDVGNTTEEEQNNYTGKCIERVKDILTIDCKNKLGNGISVPKPGKYRITYLNGAGRKGTGV